MSGPLKSKTAGAVGSLADLMRPVPSHPPEREFQDWYALMAQKNDLSPDPGGQFYDYRSAMMSGASPDETGHWPSQFKQEGHPSMVVGGFHVKTGQRVPGTPMARSPQELVALGWEPETAMQLWRSVQK